MRVWRIRAQQIEGRSTLVKAITASLGSRSVSSGSREWDAAGGVSAGRLQQDPATPGAGFLSAPVASSPVASVTVSAPVGLLTPPGGTRVDTLRAGGARPAAPAAKATARPAVWNPWA